MILTAVFLLVGAGLVFLGAIGLLRLRTFYERAHAPTLGTTLGTAFIAIASMIHFSAAGDRLVIHEVLIVVFVIATTPVSLIVLVSAARFRDDFESRSSRDRNTRQ
jgi:multicomponent K+:H+ antiporter subunit G